MNVVEQQQVGLVAQFGAHDGKLEEPDAAGRVERYEEAGAGRGAQLAAQQILALVLGRALAALRAAELAAHFGGVEAERIARRRRSTRPASDEWSRRHSSFWRNSSASRRSTLRPQAGVTKGKRARFFRASSHEWRFASSVTKRRGGASAAKRLGDHRGGAQAVVSAGFHHALDLRPRPARGAAARRAPDPRPW